MREKFPAFELEGYMDILEKQIAAGEAKRPSEDRLVMLSDGIFAIATTLLVLDIRVPDNTPPGDVDNVLANAFLVKTIFYVITFFVISIYWIGHRRTISVVRHIDRRFIWLNLLFLAFIAFFPVSSNLVGTHGDHISAVLIYTFVLSGCGFSALFLWLYATGKHRLVDADLDQRTINFQTVHILIAPIFYLASLALLPLFPSSPSIIFLSWPLITFIDIFVRRIQRRRGVKENGVNALSNDI